MIPEPSKNQNDIYLKQSKFGCTQGARAGWWFNEVNQEVRHHQGGWGHYLDHPPCLDKSQNLGFFEKINIFDFWGPKNLFWPPKTLFGIKNLTFFWGGGSYFYNFLIWAGVLELQMAKKHFFGIITPGNLQNRGLDQKVLEVWPPKKWGF